MERNEKQNVNQPSFQNQNFEEQLIQNIIQAGFDEDYFYLSDQLDFKDSYFDYQDADLYDFRTQDACEDIKSTTNQVGIIDESDFIPLENRQLDTNQIQITD